MGTMMEVQLEKLDSKLEKHIAITENILASQDRTLSEIRDIVKDHNVNFIKKEEVALMEAVSISSFKADLSTTLGGFERRLDRKYASIGVFGFTVLTVVVNIGLQMIGV